MATELEAYLRRAAAARGIDPDVVVRVAKGEGGLSDPFRRGAGPAPRSQAPGLGATENSYGPLQLYVSGTGAGLGDRAMAAGIDPSKNWKGGVDFALDEVKRKGWGQWYGAKAQGITGMMGVGGAPAAPSSPYAGLADGPKGQEAYSPPLLGPDPSTATAGIFGPLGGGSGIPSDVAQYAASDEPKSLGDRLQAGFKALAGTPDAPAVRFGQMGDARQSGDALLKAMNAPTLSDLLAKQRMVG